MKPQDYKISNEKFVFRATDGNLHDGKLQTKPVTYLRDALHRFCKNKASIVAFFIIAFLMLFALLGPILSPFTVAYEDKNYGGVVPKNQLFYDLGIPFWDGGQEKEVNKVTFDYISAIEREVGRKIIMSEPEVTTEEYMGKTKELYSFRLDTYNYVGVKYILMNTEDYLKLQRYQDEHNVQIIYPMVASVPEAQQDKDNANYWFVTKKGSGEKTEIVYDENGDLIPNYKAEDGSDLYSSKMLKEGDTKLYSYASPRAGNMWQIRVDYYEYYKYLHSADGDRISEPCFLFGTTDAGKDLFTCLAGGARFSLLFAILVASVNLFVGAIYGAIEGYYGGKIDIVMERFVEILSSVPTMIVITLLKYHLNVSDMWILFISFFLTGWTGMAARTRMQFYRFKNQEYVLVSRTLGAKDSRIMFRHIFPNAIGTLITGSVLVIPGVIFSETSLNYLGIINLSTGDMTSVGALLSSGQQYLFTHPHMLLFPALFISLLMLCFNLFGNGLRDAFNPALRGTDD